MNVLGIDIGYDRCGFAVIDFDSDRIIDSGLIMTDRKISVAERLHALREDFVYIKNRYSPAFLCVEKLFFYRKNSQFEKVCMAKGVVMEIFFDIRIDEVEPSRIKLELAGMGNASKRDMKEALARRLGLSLAGISDDEVDAICVGLYQAHRLRIEYLADKN